MRPLASIPAAGLLLACACSSPGRTHAAAPDPGARAAVASASAGDAPIRLPERIVLPASYRLVLLDGHLALVREADEQALEAAPASMRIVTGEIARGELAYQPGLLPQELAAEVAANREGSARMDNALEAVMRRSRELSEQAMELQAQSRKLADLLAAAQARVQELEAARAAARPAAEAPARTGPQE
jgi:predicted nucleic acid-binding protein